MKIIHLNDETYCEEVDGRTLFVTDYEIGDYCGSGDALSLNNGMVEVWYLGHCSCYGPMDDGPSETIKLSEFIVQNETVTCSWGDKVAERFLEELFLDGQFPGYDNHTANDTVEAALKSALHRMEALDEEFPELNLSDEDQVNALRVALRYAKSDLENAITYLRDRADQALAV